MENEVNEKHSSNFSPNNSPKDYFNYLGYKDNDKIGICFGIGGNNDAGVTRPVAFTTIGDLPNQSYYKDLQNLDETKKFKKGIFYTSATYISDTNISRKKEYIVNAKEFVIDIDYGTAGHKKTSLLDDKEKALKFVEEKLPLPTIIVCTGGGLHIHYRLKEALLPERYEKLSRAFAQHFGEVDSVCDCGHLFRIPNTYNTKNKNLKKVEIISFNDVEYSYEDFFQLIPALNNIELKNESITKKRKTSHGKKKPSAVAPSCNYDRSEIIYGIVANAIKANPNVKTDALVKYVQKNQELYEHYKSEEELRSDIIRIYSKLKSAQENHLLMEEKNLVPEQKYIDMAENERSIFDSVHFCTRKPNFDLTLGLICKCHQEKRNAILNLPCSSGKSFMSIVYAAYLAKQGKRVWIVSEQIQSCKKKAQLLKGMGISAIAYHGRDSNLCPVSCKDFLNGKKPCKKCNIKCGAQFKYLNNGGDRFDYPNVKVVCCTHANYMNALSTNQLPDDVDLIIIDESPDTLCEITMTNEDITLLYSLVDNHRDYNEKCQFEKYLQDITHYSDFGTHKISSIDTSLANNILQFAFVKYHSDALTEEEISFIQSFFLFFKNERIFGMFNQTEHNKNEFHYISGKTKIQCNIPTIILDGSARNQITEWENFIIVSCDRLKKNYPNTTLYVIKANPSKKKLSKAIIEEKLESLSEKLLHANDKAIIFQNKTPVPVVDTLIKIADKNCVNCVVMQRGEHIGSNSGKQCNKAIIAMSIFTTIPDYALKASIVNDKEIPGEEIFDSYQGRNYPAYGRDGFRNKDINKQFILAVERDLYQAIMRGCIRENNTNSYDVIALIESYSVISYLMNDLQGVKIITEDDDILNLFLQGYTNFQIQKLTNKPQSTVSSAVQRIRKCLGLISKCADKDFPDAA